MNRFESGDWVRTGVIRYDEPEGEIYAGGKNELSAIVKNNVGWVTISYKAVLDTHHGAFMPINETISIPLDVYDMLVEKIKEVRA